MSARIFFQLDKDCLYISDGTLATIDGENMVLSCYIMMPNETLHILSEKKWYEDAAVQDAEGGTKKKGVRKSTGITVVIPCGDKETDLIMDTDCKVSLELFDENLKKTDAEYNVKHNAIILQIKTDGSYVLNPGENLKFQIKIPKTKAVEGCSRVAIYFNIPTDNDDDPNNGEAMIERTRTFNLEKKQAPVSILEFVPELPYYKAGDTVKLYYKTKNMHHGVINPGNHTVTDPEGTIEVECKGEQVYTFHAYETDVQNGDNEVSTKCLVSFVPPIIRKFSMLENENEDITNTAVEWNTLNAETVLLNGKNVDTNGVTSANTFHLFNKLCVTGEGWTITNYLFNMNIHYDCSFKSINVEKKQNEKYCFVTIWWTGATKELPMTVKIASRNLQNVKKMVFIEDTSFDFVYNNQEISIIYKVRDDMNNLQDHEISISLV